MTPILSKCMAHYWHKQNLIWSYDYTYFVIAIIGTNAAAAITVELLCNVMSGIV